MATTTIQKWVAKTKADIDDVVITTCIDISTRVVNYTPVGNPSLWASGKAPKGYTGGQAKGNWLSNIGSPATPSLQPPDKAGSETIAAITAEAMGASGSVFYLTNSLPYIRRLEYEGWSTQAPSGMIRRVIAESPAIVRDVIEIIKQK